MTKAGLRELRQHASDLVRRAEHGETVTVTVSGRAVAQLGPIPPNQWRTWDDIADIFKGPSDDNWSTDRNLVMHSVEDPFAE